MFIPAPAATTEDWGPTHGGSFGDTRLLVSKPGEGYEVDLYRVTSWTLIGENREGAVQAGALGSAKLPTAAAVSCH